jgi:pimeloyl-ACP methyl ester carboxylesterase
MATFKLPPMVGRIALVLVVALALFAALLSWLYTNSIRSSFLVPRTVEAERDLEVVRVSGGRIVLPRTDETTREGIWGLESDDSYGQLLAIVGIGEDEVEWTYRPIAGSIEPGERVALDADAYPGDPLAAHGIGYEEIRLPGELGPMPAWLIEGRNPVWVVMAHDRGNDRFEQSLRMIPALVEEGYSILVVPYRNDVGSPESETGLRTWGLTEWRDLEAALSRVDPDGVEEYIFVGHDMGAEVISTFLHESDRVDRVNGVIFDSPVLDFGEIVEGTASWIPAPVRFVGDQLARMRFGLEWSELDQVDRAGEFDVPVLVLHGARDSVVPFATGTAFVESRPDLFEMVRFEKGGHGDLWNTDPARYEAAVLDFLERVSGDDATVS